ncbi:MAG: class I SAM-dependent methyltransferase [bacterium]
MDNYEQKLKREKQWYTEHTFQARHILNTKLFYTPERTQFNYSFPKKQLAKIVGKKIEISGWDNPYMLIAPLGTGDDIKYYRHMTKNIYGIDISEAAINRINDVAVKKYVGDMGNLSMFSNAQFDIVIIPLFFHHFLKFGFDGFLKEAYRVLKPGGYFFALEPSIFHPISWITRIAKRVFGNITGQVEDEAPFIPLRLINAMKRSGFQDVKVYGASFSHNRIPIWLAKINNIVSYPLLQISGLKYFAWMCIFYGTKR